jgi:hypothetical protein
VVLYFLKMIKIIMFYSKNLYIRLFLISDSWKNLTFPLSKWNTAVYNFKLIYWQILFLRNIWLIFCGILKEYFEIITFLKNILPKFEFPEIVCQIPIVFNINGKRKFLSKTSVFVDTYVYCYIVSWNKNCFIDELLLTTGFEIFIMLSC